MEDNITFPANNPHTGVIQQDHIADYSDFLLQWNLVYKTDEFYYVVGNPDGEQGWCLHISVVTPQIPELLAIIVPVLKEALVSFKLVSNREVASGVLSGHLGLSEVGKIVTIYPGDEQQAVLIAATLLPKLSTLKGPEVLSAFHLGSVVFASYRNTNSIPAQLPQGTAWPFQTIKPLLDKKQISSLLARYKITHTIKEDAKGYVWKGFFLKNLLRIKNCVIKEGRAFMMYDDHGRDIRQRLLWQKHLHDELGDVLSLPKIYDYFQIGNNSYLVMEFINGRQLDEVITDIFQRRHWLDLSVSEQVRLLDFAQQITDSVCAMHQKGFVHRDINTGNFLVTAKDRLYLIDLELAYSIRENNPSPPFIMGTEGFMSPQQEAVQTPTVQEDTYAIGATLLVLFTGLLPTKFEVNQSEILQNQLLFFIPERRIQSLIAACLQPAPENRPSLAEIKSALEKFREGLHGEKYTIGSNSNNPVSSEGALLEVINKALLGLCSEAFLSPQGMWFSNTRLGADNDYAQNRGMGISGGLYTGVSGIMQLIARAHQCGLAVKPCMPAYTRSLEVLQSAYLQVMDQVGGGLYHGMAGIGLSLAEGIKSGLLGKNPAAVQNVEACLVSQNLDGFSLADGVAGQGMALLHCQHLLSTDFAKGRLAALAGYLMDHQQKDGAWPPGTGISHKNGNELGFASGQAGIASFLVCCSSYSNDLNQRQAAERALRWLASRIKKNGFPGQGAGGRDTKQILWGFDNGLAGIALTFINAYKITGHLDYRRLAEEVLDAFPDRVCGRDLSQASGLAGLGEVYLEAAQAFDNERWWYRVNWIADLLLHGYRHTPEGNLYWVINDNPITTGDFMVGSSGIIHFLLRVALPGKLSHPILV